MQLFIWFTSITIIVNFRAAISSFYNQFSCTYAENGNQQGSPLSHCFGFIDGTVCRGGSRVVQVICKNFFSKIYASALYFRSQSQLAFLFYCLLWNKTKEIFRRSHSKPSPSRANWKSLHLFSFVFCWYFWKQCKKITIPHGMWNCKITRKPEYCAMDIKQCTL